MEKYQSRVSNHGLYAKTQTVQSNREISPAKMGLNAISILENIHALGIILEQKFSAFSWQKLYLKMGLNATAHFTKPQNVNGTIVHSKISGYPWT